MRKTHLVRKSPRHGHLKAVWIGPTGAPEPWPAAKPTPREPERTWTREQIEAALNEVQETWSNARVAGSSGDEAWRIADEAFWRALEGT